MSRLYLEAYCEGLELDPDITVSEWADQYRRLSQKASAESGFWRTDRTPYLKEIMDMLSPSSPYQRIVFMKASQLGGTEALFNWLGYIIHLTPGPTMFVLPTEMLAERTSKQRITPLIEETPVLRERIAPSRERDSGNAMLTKDFRGGFLNIVGSNSAVGLRSMPVRFLAMDELDGYVKDVSNEGSPCDLAEKRTTTFARRKVFLCSSPTVKDDSRIESEYLSSDMRKFFVPCPHCDHKQWLRWGNKNDPWGLKWDEDNPKIVQYMCESCHALIDERYKTDFLRKGEWIATNPEWDGVTVGFHLSSLYSPLGWKSWVEIVDEFLKCKSDAPRLKTFVNTVLGETWEEDYANKLGAGDLQKRAELYKAGVAPAGSILVVAGVDVQDDRLEITKMAFGFEEECWIISHEKIYGDPSRPELWTQLDENLFKPIPHEIVTSLQVAAVAIDSGGHHTHAVYQYARERLKRNVIAVKGQSQKGKQAVGKPTIVDLNFKGQVLKRGARVYPVGADTIKHVIFSRLKHNAPGPGYIHFHDELDTEYFQQLTSEKLVTRYVKGYPIREFQKKSGARNEALDCFVYAYAALQWLYTKYNRKTFFEQFEKQLKLKRESVEVSSDKELSPTALPKVEDKPTLKKVGINKHKSFVTRW